MKKVNSRDFQKDFSHHTESLKPSESLVVTKHGQPLGVFTRAGATRRRPRNFMADLEKHTYSVQTGNKLAENILNEPLL